MGRTKRGAPRVTSPAWVRIDASGLIRFVSRQAELLFGYDGDDLRGQPIETLIPEPVGKIYDEYRHGSWPWSPGPHQGPGSGAKRTAAGRALVPCEHQLDPRRHPAWSVGNRGGPRPDGRG